MKKFIFTALFVTALNSFAGAQTGATATKTTATKTATAKTVTTATATGAQTADSKAVRAAFDKLIEGIRSADVEMVTGVYQNSPGTLYYNNNGSITKGWEQDRQNREARYPNISNVKLDVRDVKVEMLGAGGAVVTCLWSQTNDYNGKPESAAGRMTLVFKKIGKDWKVVHLHTSPGTPAANRPVADSERLPKSTEPQK